MNDANLRLLEIAKELLIMEYNDKKAQDHNRWLLESEKAWRISRTKLEHPAFPPFPTHEDILQRAKTLQGFVQSTQPSTKIEPTPTTSTTPPAVEDKETSEECTTQTRETVHTVSDTQPDCTTETTATLSSDSAKLNETITDDVAHKFERDIVPGMKDFDLPENLLAYSRIKVANNLEDRVPGSARVITNLLDTLKRDKKKEK